MINFTTTPAFHWAGAHEGKRVESHAVGFIPAGSSRRPGLFCRGGKSSVMPMRGRSSDQITLRQASTWLTKPREKPHDCHPKYRVRDVGRA